MRPRDRWYVCIDHLTDQQLEFFGFYKIRDNGDFSVYAQAYGAEQQVVDNSGKRFLMVDDYNDAVHMKGDTLIRAPEDPSLH